jgi:MFS family permease
MAFGFLSFLLVNSTISLFIVQAVIGFGDAIYNPAFDALYSKHLDARKSGSQWGVWEATNYFTASFGAVMGGLIAKSFGFTPLFIIMAFLCLASAAYIYLLPRKVL